MAPCVWIPYLWKWHWNYLPYLVNFRSWQKEVLLSLRMVQLCYVWYYALNFILIYENCHFINHSCTSSLETPLKVRGFPLNQKEDTVKVTYIPIILWKNDSWAILHRLVCKYCACAQTSGCPGYFCFHLQNWANTLHLFMQWILRYGFLKCSILLP